MMAAFEELEQEAERKEAGARRWLTTDRAVIGGGIGLAAIAAFFPWYVFFNQEEFGIKPMVYSQSRDLPGGPGRNVLSVSPLAIVDNDEEPSEAGEFDPMFTATVPGLGEELQRPGAPDPLSQPFPQASTFRLLHVANGRALIEDPGGMYIVRIGSVLPDNSRLAQLEKRDGRWVIVTSEGKVIER